MTGDKYTAIWISYSSIHDFLKCPRAYFLKNIYKNPRTGHKIRLVNPHLSLGQAVHEALDCLSHLKSDKRFETPILSNFEKNWKKYLGKVGGFRDEQTEEHYKKRGREMLSKVIKNPRSLKNLAVKLKTDLPYYFLSKEDNIILCGKIDWLEYFPLTDSVHVIEFKTGKNKEAPDSLQLPIYYLLAKNCQKRAVSKVSYWYMEKDAGPEEQTLPEESEAREKILKIGKQIKLARQLDRFKCEFGGCRECQPYEKILRGEAEMVGLSERKEDLYLLRETIPEGEESVIL